MPESTSATDKRYATDIKDAVDLGTDAFLLLVIELDRELEAAARDDDDDRALLALALFLSAFDDLVYRYSDQVATLSLSSASKLYPRIEGVRLSFDTAGQIALVDHVRNMMNDARQRVRVMSNQTDLGFAKLAQYNILTRGQAYDIRKGVDALLARTAQEVVWDAGKDVYERKQAVSVLDGRTTKLCRNRMNGQIKPWDEPYVDSLSGSQWMYPPFIGALLSDKERFHFCRTVSVPFTGA